MTHTRVRWFETLRLKDTPIVGGKNASLGEMIGTLLPAGVRIPNGFATTASAFREFVSQNGLNIRIAQRLDSLDGDDIVALSSTGQAIRTWILETPLPPGLTVAVTDDYRALQAGDSEPVTVAVRSSATAEDLPDASFAGQQETYLNITGIDQVLTAVHQVYASLYNDRAIAYRIHRGYRHTEIAISVGIQRMVRSDLGTSGVLFTLDTESGFDGVVFITASWGLGESIVQGAVNPDEYYLSKIALARNLPAVLMRKRGTKLTQMVYTNQAVPGQSVITLPTTTDQQTRFCLGDDALHELSRMALVIEKHYGRPMDIEWAQDGLDGQIYILQARPETVQSRQRDDLYQRDVLVDHSAVLLTGHAIGQKIGTGRVRVIDNPSQIQTVQTGDVLVTDMTDPDWEPIMKKVAAIVTNRGGRTCHAAIIARELGIPAVVGCGNATSVLQAEDTVTVSCAEGETGKIYRGQLRFEHVAISSEDLPRLPVKLALNVGNPELAFVFQRLPNDGIGLARLEFIITTLIGVHPRACIEYLQLPDDLRENVLEQSLGYRDPIDFYRQKLIEGIATLAAAFWPKKVIVRLSDFKSNEYRHLLGGERYEPVEENPMLGFRGASRYISPAFRNCFELECQALRQARDGMGFTNIEIMVPFVRTLEEADSTLELLRDFGLQRGKNALKIVMMCEIPSNALLADQFLERFDGFSIGSNDLTQMTLAIDRDSSLVAQSFNERNPAVLALFRLAIQACRRAGKYIGICGQGPSDHPDLAHWLMDEGIEALSLNPDSLITTWQSLGKVTNRKSFQDPNVRA